MEEKSLASKLILLLRYLFSEKISHKNASILNGYVTVMCLNMYCCIPGMQTFSIFQGPFQERNSNSS